MSYETISQDRFSTLLGVCIVPSVLSELGVDDEHGIAGFYESRLYETLGDRKTGLWHLSAPTLAAMYREELAGGVAHMPEEQS